MQDIPERLGRGDRQSVPATSTAESREAFQRHITILNVHFGDQTLYGALLMLE